MEEDSLKSLIDKITEFELQPGLSDFAQEIFEYTQFLLDKDENLTKTGNLNSKALDLLENRIIEIIGLSENPEDEIIDA